MFNLLWGLLFVLANFGLFIVSYRLFGKNGLYAWVAFATVIANIQVVKTIEVVGIITTLGNTIYASIYMATDLLNEKHGAKDARKAVWLGFFSLIASTIMMQMALVFQPQPGDQAQQSMETIFGLLPRLALASLAAYFVSQLLDVRLFSYLKKKFPARNQLWIRMNGSSTLSQLVDSLVFCTIAFAMVYPWEVWLQILITTYVFKFVISIASTPVLYIARRFHHPEDERSAA
ncbi:queuosine precursor transporter [Paenibacillus sp. GCM10012307]|uniref:Probable queuosine precursor transporter n=1 Tax=Paenibacillus roseus TaxID=2798579 RepID=A0A934J6U4_9BACL|nr:queuosine precursor transporter [Paenibacillus roseus]MBJ6363975.1 queuosine precursor transporter [Paenibacillus roseus]